MKFRLLFLSLLILPAFLLNAQKVEKQSLEFEYIQLPLSPPDASIKNYHSLVIMSFEADIIAEKQKAQEDYDRELAEYPQKEQAAAANYKAAMEKYEADMKLWEEKSTASKIIEKKILEENNKPVKPGNYYPPSKPYLREVNHQKIFNAEMLANTYLKIDGYSNGTENALKVTTTLYGFESLEPVLKTEESSMYDSKTKTTTKVVSYWYEISYRHPINLKVETTSGQVLVDETFALFNEYSINNTGKTKGQTPSFNKEEYLKKLQSEVVESNMKYINEFLNSNYGYPKLKRNTIIYTVETKKFPYDEYTQAFASAREGYNLLLKDVTAARGPIETAIQLWEKALLESNPADNKSRINSDVTIITLFNLAEANIWINEFSKADDYLNRVAALNPSKKEKAAVEEYREMLKDHKARWEANKK